MWLYNKHVRTCTLCGHCKVLYSNDATLSIFRSFFFSNFHFKIHTLALSHVFAFHPKLSLTFISLGILLHFLKNLWDFSLLGGMQILLFWLGQRWLWGPIHFFQHCRASAVAQSKQKPDACLSANSMGYIKRRWSWVENLITEASNAKLHSGLQRTPKSTRIRTDNVFL